MPIGGSALQTLPTSLRRTLYVATAVPVRGIELMTLRILLENALFTSTRELRREARATVCRMINTRYSRKASQSAACHLRIRQAPLVAAANIADPLRQTLYAVAESRLGFSMFAEGRRHSTIIRRIRRGAAPRPSGMTERARPALLAPGPCTDTPRSTYPIRAHSRNRCGKPLRSRSCRTR